MVKTKSANPSANQIFFSVARDLMRWALPIFEKPVTGPANISFNLFRFLLIIIERFIFSSYVRVAC